MRYMDLEGHTCKFYGLVDIDTVLRVLRKFYLPNVNKQGENDQESRFTYKICEKFSFFSFSFSLSEECLRGDPIIQHSC